MFIHDKLKFIDKIVISLFALIRSLSLGKLKERKIRCPSLFKSEAAEIGLT